MYPSTSSAALPIPSPSHSPVTPDMEMDPEDHQDLHASPSFSFHEERRLHLKDEIWLSHHGARIPPPPSTISASSSTVSGPSSPKRATNAVGRQRLVPDDVLVASQALTDPSPSAFHPLARGPPSPVDAVSGAMHGMGLRSPRKAGAGSTSGPPDKAAEEDHRGGAVWHNGAAVSGMLSPSEPADEDMDPAPALLHRKELDDQERLDLEEEERERLLSARQDDYGYGTAKLDQQPSDDAGPAQSSTKPERAIGSELDQLYVSFARCLELRDKYIGLSCQRLGDNPRDHDGSFSGFSPKSAGDVSGLKPNGDIKTCEDITPSDPSDHTPTTLPPWTIYPAPPPPNWHWKPSDDGYHPEPGTFSSRPSGSDGPGPSGTWAPQGFHFEDCPIPGEAKQKCDFGLNEEGVYEVWHADEQPEPVAGPSNQSSNTSPVADSKQRLVHVPSLKEYFTDLDYLLTVCSDGPAKSFAFRRLKYLASKWSLYCLLNEYQELADMKAVPHRDFYNVRKVDTHIHHSASMNQKHLLRFIKSKLKKVPDETVIHRDGKDLTLKEVFESLNLTAYDLSIDTLDMHAHQEFHRFDRFNDRYNPTGSSRLREIFLKTDNLLKGKYLAEITQELIQDLEQSKYQQSEWRLSIYGRNPQEWDKLAKWVINNKLISHNVRWLIQVPRLYEVLKGAGQVNTFEDIVKNVFGPLFEVTRDPRSHPELHVFLQRVVGFDSVDDESKPERRLYRKFPTAKMWNTRQSPPYSYWIYYMYANMSSLNNWRSLRGFNTFVLRPHCGEAGDPDHLSSAFLTAHSISHGILLRKVPALQYLFYLKQIGLAMSPLSNNALFLSYERNPFKDFFRVGLNVSLSTDDPLQFHFTQSHLLEEYSCAAQIYKLTPADMCELARNSVVQSGWEMQVKKHWIGQKWYLPGAAGNDIHKTNVPTIRLAYRHATLLEEWELVAHGRGSSSSSAASAVPPQNRQMRNVVNAKPGLTSHSSDVGAAAMATTQSFGHTPEGGAAPPRMAGASVLGERQQWGNGEGAVHEMRR